MNKKNEGKQVTKEENQLPKFRTIKSHETYDTWNTNPIESRVGYSLDTQIERDKLF
jgi:hypothetical protein